MTNDIEAINQSELDEILKDWHRWAASEAMTGGFSDKSAVIGDFPGYGALQYESQQEQKDADADAERCELVNAQVLELGEPYSSAIQANARNLASAGAAVWSSPRLPKWPLERQVVVKAARTLLMKRLIGVGVGNWLVNA